MNKETWSEKYKKSYSDIQTFLFGSWLKSNNWVSDLMEIKIVFLSTLRRIGDISSYRLKKYRPTKKAYSNLKICPFKACSVNRDLAQMKQMLPEWIFLLCSSRACGSGNTSLQVGHVWATWIEWFVNRWRSWSKADLQTSPHLKHFTGLLFSTSFLAFWKLQWISDYHIRS